MRDIINELRNPGHSMGREYKSLSKLCGEAADEIERLRTALQAIRYGNMSFEQIAEQCRLTLSE